MIRSNKIKCFECGSAGGRRDKVQELLQECRESQFFLTKLSSFPQSQLETPWILHLEFSVRSKDTKPGQVSHCHCLPIPDTKLLSILNKGGRTGTALPGGCAAQPALEGSTCWLLEKLFPGFQRLTSWTYFHSFKLCLIL